MIDKILSQNLTENIVGQKKYPNSSRVADTHTHTHASEILIWFVVSRTEVK